MAAFWFYRPRSLLARIGAVVRYESWTHVGIQHAVSDVAVLTESDPHKGVWCSPLSNVRKADAVVHAAIPDAFLTKWLIERWGVRYGWMDGLVHTVPSYVHDGKLGTEAGALIVRLIRDARAEGIAVPGGALVALDPDRPSVSAIYAALTSPTA